jgi:HEAT repeat protein
MTTARKITLAVAVVALIGLGVGLLFPRANEPSYQGRPLSQWLADLDSTDTGARERARGAFRAMGDSIVPALVEIIHRDSKPAGEVGNRAYNGLIIIARTNPAALAALTDLLYFEGAAGDAALSLAALNPAGIPALTNAAGSGYPVLRTRVAGALGTMPEAAEAVAPTLIELLRDPERNIRQMALVSLGQIGPEPPGVVAAVARRLKDDSSEIRAVAAQTLGKFGTAAREAIPALEAASNDPLAVVRQDVADALKRIGGGTTNQSTVK